MANKPTDGDKNKDGNVRKVEDLVNWEEFIVTATDAHGHTRRAQFYTTPRMLNQIDVIISSKIFPGYKTRGALIRHALMKHFRYLERLAEQLGGKHLPNVLHELEAINEILREEEFQKEIVALVDRMKMRVSDYISHGAEDEARRVVLKSRRHLKAMPSGYWRDRCVEDINNNFGYLLKSAERASLIKLAAD